MRSDIEARLRAADPVRHSQEQDSQDLEWLRGQVARATAASEVATGHAPSSRKWAMAAAAAVAAASGVGVATTSEMFRSSDDPMTRNPVTRDDPLDLSMQPEGGDKPTTSASCVPFSVETLRDMPIALSGTVSEKNGEQVLLNVDRWYAGGEADQVSLLAPDMSMTSLTELIEFKEGQRYLLTAGDGIDPGDRPEVNYCGHSAPWNARLAEAYELAFDDK